MTLGGGSGGPYPTQYKGCNRNCVGFGDKQQPDLSSASFTKKLFDFRLLCVLFLTL